MIDKLLSTSLGYTYFKSALYDNITSCEFKVVVLNKLIMEALGKKSKEPSLQEWVKTK